MAGSLMWGYDSDNKKWVKLRVDSDGSFHIVGYIDKLEDIGDVLLTALANNDILYRDISTGKWKNLAHLGLPNAHHNEAHSLASHFTKAHAELTNVTASQHHTKYLNAAAVSAVEAAGLILDSGKNIGIARYLTDPDLWSGLTTMMIPGEDLVKDQIVYIGADQRMFKAQANATGTMPAIAIATESMDEDNAGEFLLQGFIWNTAGALTPGSILYVSDTTAGLLTQARPALAGRQVQVIGMVMDAYIIYFNPSYELVEISA